MPLLPTNASHARGSRGRVMTAAVTDFKAHALQVLGEVARTREPVLITKRGRPLAEVVPFSEHKPSCGQLVDTLVFEKDIVSPLGEDMWNAAR